MKYLLVLAVLLIAWGLWRSARDREEREEREERESRAAPRRDVPALPQDMVRCPVCAVHLPRPDAVAGASGRLYCSADHRRDGGN